MVQGLEESAVARIEEFAVLQEGPVLDQNRDLTNLVAKAPDIQSGCRLPRLWGRPGKDRTPLFSAIVSAMPPSLEDLPVGAAADEPEGRGARIDVQASDTEAVIVKPERRGGLARVMSRRAGCRRRRRRRCPGS